jgi:hypothetical protein
MEETKREVRKAERHSKKNPEIFKFFSVRAETEEKDITTNTSKDVSQGDKATIASHSAVTATGPNMIQYNT